MGRLHTEGSGFHAGLRFKEIRGVKVFYASWIVSTWWAPQNHPHPQKEFPPKQIHVFHPMELWLVDLVVGSPPPTQQPEATTLEDHIFH